MPKNRRPDQLGFRIGFHLLVVTLCAWLQAGAADITTADHKEVVPLISQLVKKYGAENVLVLYDYDNTLAGTRGYLGSEAWFEKVLHAIESRQSPIPNLSNYDDLIDLQHAIFRRYPSAMTEPDLPKHVAAVQATGARVQVMSSRNDVFFDVVIQELQKFGIDFTSSAIGPFGGWQESYPMLGRGEEELLRLAGNAPHRQVSFRNGLYLTAGQNKGVALRALLKKTGYQPKAVVLIDDRPRHLDGLEVAFQGTSIETVTVRYSRNDGQRQKHEAVSPQEAWQWLLRAMEKIPRNCAENWAQFARAAALFAAME